MTLLRARAIENLAYVIAPGQYGNHPDTRRATFGHSSIIDPWGRVLATRPDEGNCIRYRGYRPGPASTAAQRVSGPMRIGDLND